MGSESIKTKLGEICNFSSGSAFPKDYQGQAVGKYPFIKVSDLNISGNERHILGSNNWLDELNFKELGVKLHPKEAVVFAKIGVALTYNRRRILTMDTIIDNNMMSASPLKSHVSPLFFFYLLRTIDFNMYSVGTALPYLNISDLRQITVEIPDMQTQKAIEAVLGSLDDKIELNRQINEKLEGIAQALFKSWFMDFDPVRAKSEGRDTGLPEHISSLFPASFIDSELGQIPEGWRVSRIEELCDFIENGSTPKRMVDQYWNGRINWFKTGELKDSPLICSEEKITLEGLKNSSCRIWPAGTILVALYASPTVGRLGILTLEGTSNQACSALKAKQCVGNQYLFYTLLFNRESLQRIAVGAAQQNISQGVLRAHKVLAPSVELSGLFQERMEPALLFKTSLLKENAVLANLRDTLLPKLISGELPIPDAERIVGRYL